MVKGPGCLYVRRRFSGEDIPLDVRRSDQIDLRSAKGERQGYTHDLCGESFQFLGELRGGRMSGPALLEEVRAACHGGTAKKTKYSQDYHRSAWSATPLLGTRPGQLDPNVLLSIAPMNVDGCDGESNPGAAAVPRQTKSYAT
jgi:hypothetical protein